MNKCDFLFIIKYRVQGCNPSWCALFSLLVEETNNKKIMKGKRNFKKMYKVKCVILRLVFRK